HPVGATGISMHALTAMQLTGQAGAMQLPKADLGGVFNMGGAAVANYVSILERAGSGGGRPLSGAMSLHPAPGRQGGSAGRRQVSRCFGPAIRAPGESNPGRPRLAR